MTDSQSHTVTVHTQAGPPLERAMAGEGGCKLRCGATREVGSLGRTRGRLCGRPRVTSHEPRSKRVLNRRMAGRAVRAGSPCGAPASGAGHWPSTRRGAAG